MCSQYYLKHHYLVQAAFYPEFKPTEEKEFISARDVYPFRLECRNSYKKLCLIHIEKGPLCQPLVRCLVCSLHSFSRFLLLLVGSRKCDLKKGPGVLSFILVK